MMTNLLAGAIGQPQDDDEVARVMQKLRDEERAAAEAEMAEALAKGIPACLLELDPSALPRPPVVVKLLKSVKISQSARQGAYVNQSRDARKVIAAPAVWARPDTLNGRRESMRPKIFQGHFN
jgi:hypothetical protein